MWKKLLACCLVVMLAGPPLPVVRADDNDIFGANIQPNILLFVDSSGSMADYIDQAVTGPYDPSTTYTPDPSLTAFSRDKVYNCPSSSDCEAHPTNNAVYTDDIASVPNADVPPPASASAARDALATLGKWNGRINGSGLQLRTGNYLNYHFSANGGHEQKIVITKRVLTNLINATDGVRFGLAKFTGNDSQGPGGAAIIADVGSSKSALTTALDAITPSGFTPLKGALYDMGNYYKGKLSGHPSPIQYECQTNFIIMMSDGLQNGYGDVRDEATLRRTQDHATSLAGTQNVLVHTVGFAIPGSEAAAANDVLQTTATNGGGKFYSTTSEAQLEAALEDAIHHIMEAAFAFASPVVPSTSATGTHRTYQATFQSDATRPFWRGFLKAYAHDASGNVPVDATTGLPTQAPVWEAGLALSNLAAADRRIYTVGGTGTTLVEFTTSTITPDRLGFAATDTTSRDKLVGFLRGVDTYDENGDGNIAEERAWKLGDIYHSTPVLITAPNSPSSDSSYIAFKKDTAVQNRTPILLAGANDGMLHAFRESDGSELWAFIPPNILGSLQQLTVPGGTHPFLVDGSPIAADVKIAIPTDSTVRWRTIVVFGLRRGGRYYYALDITDPNSPIYLWGFTDTKMGETWSNPIIGKVKLIDGSVKFVAFVGGGYDTVNNNQTGKAVFAIDLAPGTKLWEYYNGPGSPTDDRQHMNFSIPADVTAVDLNMDGYIDRLYVGDVGGQVWKFDLSPLATLSGGTSGTFTNWSGKRLFAAPLAAGTTNPPAAGEYYPAEAIYAPIIPAVDEQSNVWIYFGTGDRNHPTTVTVPNPNPSSKLANRFYGIKDNIAMTDTRTLTEGDLVDITSAQAAVVQGYYIRLTAKDASAPSSVVSSEKVFTAANVFNKIVYFTSFTPSGSPSCGSGGTPKLYAVKMLTGYAALDWYNPGGIISLTESRTDNRSRDLGSGIPSKPIITITDLGMTSEAWVLVGTSSQELTSNRAPGTGSLRKILYWREVF